MGEKSTSDKNSSFLMQGLFLALASVISRVIGLIYRVPLTNIIGKTGNDNYGTAFEIYNLFLIISSYSLPLAISKMIAARMSEGKIKDAAKVLRLGMVFAVISGSIVFCIVFFGADYWAGEVLKTPYAATALKTLAPALFVVAVLGVLRGFFQGLGTSIPTAISQVLEQIVNAVISIVAAYYLFSFGLATSSETAAAYGAAGGTLGTVAGAVAALLFMLFVFYAYSRVFKKKVRRDTNDTYESSKNAFKILILTIVPVLISTTLYNVVSIIDQGIYKNIALFQGHAPLEISEYWGVFTGQYRVLVNIPIAIASALAVSVVPSLTASHRRKSGKEVRTKIGLGMRFIMIVSFPCMVGLMVLSQPIMQLLFSDYETSSALMLIIGSFSVVFYCISTYTNAVLQGIDKMSKPVIHALISLILQVAVLIGVMLIFDLNIYAVIVANIFYAFMMSLLNGISVRRYTRIKYPIRKTYIIPLLCSVIMGIAVFAIYYLLNHFANSLLLAVSVSILVGMALYFVLIIKFKGINENDMLGMPKGRIIVKVARKLRLL